MVMLKCLICDLQPRATDSLYCHNCGAKLKVHAAKNREPSTFLVYQDNVVGLIPNGHKDSEGRELFTPVLLKRKPEGLPKGKTVDLNVYCEGYTREQIKHLKAVVKHTAG
jgi:hypothetical protein